MKKEHKLQLIKDFKEQKGYAVINKIIPSIYFCDLDFENGIQRWGVFRDDEKKFAKEMAKQMGGKLVKCKVVLDI